MRLSLADFRIIKPSLVEEETNYSKIKETKLAPPSSLVTLKAIDKVLKANGETQVKTIISSTKITESAVRRALKHMIEGGDVFKTKTVPIRYALTGTSTLLDEAKGVALKGKRVASNNKTGVAGVSYSEQAKRFVTSFGRGKVWRFDTLLDAVCKRRSLELNKGLT